MKRVFLVCLLNFIFKVFGLVDYEPTDNPQICFVGESAGTCVPLPECLRIVSQLLDSGTARKALTLARQRKCGFDYLNIEICCLESEMKVDAISRFGNNETDGSSITEDSQSWAYVETFDEPPACGEALSLINSGFCRPKRHAYQKAWSYPVIAGGKRLAPGFAPWMALLGYRPSASFWECGGSIITRRHILTAAHCINDRLFLVRVGELDLASDEDGAAPADYLIQRKIPHEHYDSRTHVNDIGILLLEQDIIFTMGVQSSQLLYANIKIFETSYCQHQYRNYSNAVIDDRMICAGDLNGINDSCKGDSGGPLVVKMCGEGFRWHYTQVGVVSYGRECARAGYPGLYTRVEHYMPWIREKIIGKAN